MEILTSTTNTTIDKKLEVQIPDQFAGPAWNNSTEYPSRDSNEFTRDLEMVTNFLERIHLAIEEIKPALAPTAPSELHDSVFITRIQEIADLREQAIIRLGNMLTYVSCERSINGLDVGAQKLHSELSQNLTKLSSTTKIVSLFLARAPESIVELYLQHPATRDEEFQLRRTRSMSDLLLTEKEETLLDDLGQHGPTAWGELYNQISGTLRCEVKLPSGETKNLGLAQTAGLIRDESEPTRRAAWDAIRTAWKTNEQSCAAILNGLAGWRIETYRRRSQTRKIDFLEFPLHESGIKSETLDAMFEALQSEVEMPRRALRALARGMGKQKADPWDLLAPAPARPGVESRRSYREGLSIIREAFARVDSGFGDFVDTMEKNRWIDGRVLDNKRQGAYCTRFLKSRTPRVFQTYMGSISDIRTLAHELGHAYHAWVMRDLPLALHEYPMTLAETASIFAETAFADHMSSLDEAAKFEIAWQNAESATAFLLNIPARFDFEKSFYEQRAHSFVSPQELGDLTEAAWTKWYGDSISKPDRQFWMSKLHFSISDTSFYNFPYTFGYLFSLGIYALKEQQGASFMPSYISLLRDTGRMTAEDLVQNYLGEDITRPEFWKKSLAIVAGQVQTFEDMLG